MLAHTNDRRRMHLARMTAERLREQAFRDWVARAHRNGQLHEEVNDSSMLAEMVAMRALRSELLDKEPAGRKPLDFATAKARIPELIAKKAGSLHGPLEPGRKAGLQLVRAVEEAMADPKVFGTLSIETALRQVRPKQRTRGTVDTRAPANPTADDQQRLAALVRHIAPDAQPQVETGQSAGAGVCRDDGPANAAQADAERKELVPEKTLRIGTEAQPPIGHKADARLTASVGPNAFHAGTKPKPAAVVGAKRTAPARKGRGWVFRVALPLACVLISFGVAQVALHVIARKEIAAERLFIEARASELKLRATVPGSAQACLETVPVSSNETACERVLFATPEAVAAALSYVSAQLSLLADATNYAQRGGVGHAGLITRLRSALEADRFGFVAHVLAERDECTSWRCAAFAFLSDPGRVSVNLAEATFDRYMRRHSENWADATKPAAEPAGSLPRSADGASANAAVAARTPSRDLFFPSAASIPPVNIMVAEPAIPVPVSAKPSASGNSAAAPAPTATPTRRSAQPAPSMRQPTNLQPTNLLPQNH